MAHYHLKNQADQKRIRCTYNKNDMMLKNM